MSTFDTIAHWHGQKISSREIARQLNVDRKTVRRAIAKIEAGINQPTRITPPSKLAAYYDRIAVMTKAGRTAISIYTEFQIEPEFTASYTLLKRHVAQIKLAHPKIYERLEHHYGDELQLDFGELASIEIQGRKTRIWALVGIWPASRYRFSVIVLDQSVPSFLEALQQGIRSSGTAAKRVTIDNFKSGVLRDQLKMRMYQHDFSAFCAHYGMMPNAARPYTPTDKGMVENAVKSLKLCLKGITVATLDEVKALVAEKTLLINNRVHAATHRVPHEEFKNEQRGELPDIYPIGTWGQYRVRKDCHIQVLANYYSVPFQFVGKLVDLRYDASSIIVFDSFVEIARHERSLGKGCTVTNRLHYPEHKQPTIAQRRAQKLLALREKGAGVAAFVHGIEQSREVVSSDHIRGLIKLADTIDATELNLACARAVHFGNYAISALKKIIDERLYRLPLDDLSIPLSIAPPSPEIRQCLEVYASLLGAS